MEMKVNIKIHETSFGTYRFLKDEDGSRHIVYESANGRSKARWKLTDKNEPELTEKIGPGSTTIPRLVLNNIPA